MRPAAFALVLLIGFAPSLAHAWGAEGHRLVADIALTFLDPPARREVDALLAAELSLDANSRVRTLADAAVWLDEVRNARPETRGWHFDNVPLCRSAEFVAHCVDDQCASAQIRRMTATLADHHGPIAARVEALKVIAHLVGDIHQPLHSADNADRGGNDIPVDVGGPKMSNLHAWWDIEAVRRFRSERGTSAAALAKRVGWIERRQWSRGNADEWVAEARRVAVRITYGKLERPPACGVVPTEPMKLDDRYITAARSVVADQLTRAGVRLAALLNRALAGR